MNWKFRPESNAGPSFCMVVVDGSQGVAAPLSKDRGPTVPHYYGQNYVPQNS